MDIPVSKIYSFQFVFRKHNKVFVKIPVLGHYMSHTESQAFFNTVLYIV